MAGDDSKFAIWNASDFSNEACDNIVACMKLASKGSREDSYHAIIIIK